MGSGFQLNTEGTVLHTKGENLASQEVRSRAAEGLSGGEREALEHLLGSRAIARAPRLRSVLKFLIESMLNGQSESINEQSIGEAVFGRPPGYNPADDNIVRVTIRHLRERIEEFYRTEGKDEMYAFDIPKGKYVPSLVRRTIDSAVPVAIQDNHASVDIQASPEITSAVSEGPPLPKRSPFRMLIAPGLITAFFLGNVILGTLLYLTSAHETAPTSRGILRVLLLDGDRTTVVVTDSNLQAYRDIFKKQITLESYLHYSYVQPQIPSNDPILEGAWRYVNGGAATTLTSAVIAAEIQAAAAPQQVAIKHPHDLSLRDLQHDNFILLGGPWIDPWGQLFENKLSFRVVPNENDPAGSEILNLQPSAGEPKIFRPYREGSLSVNYIRIAVLRNLTDSGYIILLGATSDDALQAGGQFLMAKDSLKDLLQFLKMGSMQRLPSFEVVLKVQGLQNVPDNIQIVTAREVHATF